MHAVTSLFLYFNDLRKPTEVYIYARNKRPFTSYPAAKHQKHSKFAITNVREKPVEFFMGRHGGLTLASAIILLT